MKFVKLIKQLIRYADARKQTLAWLEAFDEAADKATSFEDVVFECTAPLCNAEFWYRTAKHELEEAKKVIKQN